MSNKRKVPTFRVRVRETADWLEGPVVSPRRREVAENLTDVHELLTHHGGILVYVGEWTYVPLHAVIQVRRGHNLFNLPWPLEDEPNSAE